MSNRIVPYAGNRNHKVGDLVRFPSGVVYRVEKDGVSTPTESELLRADLARVREVRADQPQALLLPSRWEDVVLPEDEIKRCRSYSSGSEKFFRDYVRAAKVRHYIDLHLIREAHTTQNLGNCYNSGTDWYIRVDHQPIRMEDLIAVQANSKGQVNRAEILPDGLTIERYWECDSSG